MLRRGPVPLHPSKGQKVRLRSRVVLNFMREAGRALLCSAFLCIGLVTGSAAAELTHRVVLLNPLAPDEITLEAITRIRGELNAAGFDVIPVQHRSGAEPREELESAARDVGAL